ncbi:MAG: 4-oxalomesaconate tautomerase [Rhizobiaceae bacterium]
MSEGVDCMWMRGGTSKGGYFLASDLPQEVAARDAFLLSLMGSPDSRQIDGMGGADPLTSKVAVVKKSNAGSGTDVDYLFLQVAVDTPLVSDAQNCGNILAGVAPFAIERGLIAPENGETRVAVHMENSGQSADITVSTPGGIVDYVGSASIDGVPGSASPVAIAFNDTAGSSCGALLPTGNVVDVIENTKVTLIDNGMPCVILRASDMGITGTEDRQTLENDMDLRSRLEAIRLRAGPAMNLGDVVDKTVPKMTMVSAAKNGGAISTRTFIPHRCHASIGVLGAVSVATACLLKDSVAAELAQIPLGKSKELKIEHPIGQTTIVADIDEEGNVTRAAILRTARKLFDGKVFAR